MFWQVEGVPSVPSVPDFQSIPGVPSVPCVPCFSNDHFYGSVLLPQDTPRHPRTPQDALLYLKDISKYLCLFIFIIILLI